MLRRIQPIIPIILCLILQSYSHYDDITNVIRKTIDPPIEKRNNNNDSLPHVDVTSELHKIIRWKSQPSYYTAPLKYEEMVAVTVGKTTVSTEPYANITAQHWTPIEHKHTTHIPKVTTPEQEKPPLTEIETEETSEPTSTVKTTAMKTRYEAIPDSKNEEVADSTEAYDDQEQEITTETLTNTTKIKYFHKEMCLHYKSVKKQFRLEEMEDVWQTVFYALTNRLHCFRILIKKLSDKEKLSYANQYGNFDGIINWPECNLEVFATIHNGRRHFIQGVNEDDGILDNIIIEENDNAKDDETQPKPKVNEESSDQWYVHENLLLLRDCDTGGIVVFKRDSAKVNMKEIEEALEAFGETSNGRMACEEENNDKEEDGEKTEDRGREDDISDEDKW